MASGKPNKLAFLSMPAPASYVAGLGRGYAFKHWSFSDFTLTWFTVLRVSQPVLILVLHEKVHLLKLSRK